MTATFLITSRQTIDPPVIGLWRRDNVTYSLVFVDSMRGDCAE